VPILRGMRLLLPQACARTTTGRLVLLLGAALLCAPRPAAPQGTGPTSGEQPGSAPEPTAGQPEQGPATAPAPAGRQDAWWQALPAPQGWGSQQPSPPAAPGAAAAPLPAQAAPPPAAPAPLLFPPPLEQGGRLPHPVLPPPSLQPSPRPPPLPPSPAPAAVGNRIPAWDDEDEPQDTGGWGVPPHAGRRSEPPPPWSSPAGRFLSSSFLAEVQLLGGWLTGLAAQSHDLASPGFGLGLTWRFLGHLALELAWARPTTEQVAPLPEPLKAQSETAILDGGARLYLAGEGRVLPWFGVGYSRFELSTTYEKAELLETSTVAKAMLSGDALRLAMGLEVQLLHFSMASQELTLAATAAARYLLLRWDELYCFDREVLAGPDGRPRRCVYENEQGAYGRTDLILASLGVALIY